MDVPTRRSDLSSDGKAARRAFGSAMAGKGVHLEAHVSSETGKSEGKRASSSQYEIEGRWESRDERRGTGVESSCSGGLRSEAFSKLVEGRTPNRMQSSCAEARISTECSRFRVEELVEDCFCGLRRLRCRVVRAGKRDEVVEGTEVGKTRRSESRTSD